MTVLVLLAEGRTNREIGEALGMTLDGAKWHVGEIISKLGVGSREEAAEYWRRQQSLGRRVSRAMAAVSLRWVTAGAAAFAAGGLAVLAVVALSGGDDAPPASVATAEATETPTEEPTEAPLTAEEILHRSEEAMSRVSRVRVEFRAWPLRPTNVEFAIEIREYSGRQFRYLHREQAEINGCRVFELPFVPYTQRSLGALALYPEDRHKDRGATAPEIFELLGSETIGGQEAWVIRYAFSYPSIENPVQVEDTEWIAKDDYRLLRREREQFDAFGFIGQVVEVFLRYDEPASQECPAAPLLTVEDLRPLTTPRLESPHR